MCAYLHECAEARCGDGIQRGDVQEGQEGYEACDDGNEIQTDACLNGCSIATCGDGQTRLDLQQGQEGYESCDDSNEVNTDACTNICILARCGDSVIYEGFEGCDDGNQVQDDGCNNICRIGGCGDGEVRDDEVCDDGNNDDDDACRNTCRPASCGDGMVRQDIARGEPGHEACDDGNNDNGDNCNENCQLERNGDLGTIAFCGDGMATPMGGGPQRLVGIFNSRSLRGNVGANERHPDHDNWDSFCRANGYAASNTGYGNSNRACDLVMTDWFNHNVRQGAGIQRSLSHVPNRVINTHIYMTCIVP